MTFKCVCVSFVCVLCHPAAPDGSENVQSDESENGILSQKALSRLTHLRVVGFLSTVID